MELKFAFKTGLQYFLLKKNILKYYCSRDFNDVFTFIKIFFNKIHRRMSK